MSVYIVSWGVIDDDRRIEADSIVHESLRDAREEFDLIDPAAAVGGSMAKAADQNGWPRYCRIDEVEMLDEKERPTSKISNWVFDASKTLVDEKVSA